MAKSYPIGIFDSGYGGLTVLKELINHLPQYDFYYLADNARSPYGTRSFDVVYTYTLQAVKKLFNMGCQLVILACNTASAKALRTIQQNDLPKIDPSRRVLGIIRPSVEELDNISKSNNIGILATKGTVASLSYLLEIRKLYPKIKLWQEPCPMWVPLIENNEHNREGADYFVKQHIENLISKSRDIDTIILACTHYPLLINKIRKYTPDSIKIISQGKIVAKSLADYLKRHPEIDNICSKNGKCWYYTTENAETFAKLAKTFYADIKQVYHTNIQ